MQLQGLSSTIYIAKYRSCDQIKEFGVDQSVVCLFDVHHFPMLHVHLNVYSCTCIHLVVSLEWGIHGLCILMNSFDLRCENVT